MTDFEMINYFNFQIITIVILSDNCRDISSKRKKNIQKVNTKTSFASEFTQPTESADSMMKEINSVDSKIDSEQKKSICP